MFKCAIKCSLFAMANNRDIFFFAFFTKSKDLEWSLLFFLYLCFAEGNTVS